MYIVAALYKFVPLPDCARLRQPLVQLCEDHDITGTLLLAGEGINGTVAGSRRAIDALRDHLNRDERLRCLEYKESTATRQPFKRLKIRLRNEIVTLGRDDVNPAQLVGQYIDPRDWNDLIADPDITLIDTRNEYETAIGTFEGAIDPRTDSFTEFPEFVERQLDPAKHKKVAMFCTGGIRCEKATSLLRLQGFENVYHLKGGILEYLKTVPPEQSKWRGECFVFDRRVAVKHGLEQGTHEQCWACGRPVSPEDRQSPQYIVNESCPACFDDDA